MRKPQITDGEWNVSEYCPGYVHAITTDGARHIAGCTHALRQAGDIEDRANARFIAASKKMAEALELAMQYVQATEAVIPRGPDGKNLVTPDLEKIKSALIAAGYEF